VETPHRWKLATAVPIHVSEGREDCCDCAALNNKSTVGYNKDLIKLYTRFDAIYSEL
jgi:hypothetical protein